MFAKIRFPLSLEWPLVLQHLTQQPSENLSNEEILFRNRLILDQDLEKYIKDVWNVERVVSLKDVSTGEFHTISTQTARAVQSYVLVDYANALFAYYWRYGDRKKLDSARKCYKMAIECMPENKIAHLNLGNALSQSNGHEFGALEQFAEAANQDPQWQLAVISQGRARIDSYDKQIKRAIARGDLLGSSRSHRYGMKKIYDFGSIQTSPGIAKADIDRGLESFNEALSTEVSKILRETRLFAIVEGIGSGQSSKLSKYLLPGMKTDRLNELDVDALSIWMSMIATQYPDDKYFELAGMIGEQILERYYPDNFNISSRLRDMYLQRKQLLNDREQRQNINHFLVWCKKLYQKTVFWRYSSEEAIDYKILQCEHAMRHVDDYSLLQKKNEYIALTWLPVLYGGKWRDKFSPYLEKAIENGSSPYINLHADFLYNEAIDRTGSDREKGLVESIEASTMAIETSKYVARYYWRRGESYSKLNNYVDALKDFKEASALSPDNSYYLWCCGYTLINLAKPDKAKSMFKQAISIDSHYPHYHWDYGDAFRSLKEWSEAAWCYERAAKLDSDDGRYHNMMGNINFERASNLLEQSKQEQAMEYFKTARNHYTDAHKIHPNLGSYCYYISLAEIKLGNFMAAKKQLKNAIRQDPYYFGYYHELAKLQISDGKTSTAKATLAKGQRKASSTATKLTHAYALNDLGIILFQKKMYRQAADMFSEVNSIVPDDPVIIANIADAEVSAQNEAEKQNT